MEIYPLLIYGWDISNFTRRDTEEANQLSIALEVDSITIRDKSNLCSAIVSQELLSYYQDWYAVGIVESCYNYQLMLDDATINRLKAIERAYHESLCAMMKKIYDIDTEKNPPRWLVFAREV